MRRASRRAPWLGCALALLASCQRSAPPPAPRPHFVAPTPWRGATGAWFYPRARYGGSFTGYAVAFDGTGKLATDGAAIDPASPSAAVQSLQLPVVLRVTDLANGRQITVRADQRGPDDPGRVLGLDAAARRLLGIGADAGPVPVAVAVEPEPSEAVADALGGLPHAANNTAPEDAVASTPLGPPGGAATAGARTGPIPAATAPGGGGAADASAAAPDGAGSPLGAVAPRPAVVATGPVETVIDAGRFSSASAASTVAAAINGDAIRTGTGRDAGWLVRTAPFATVADADRALDRARRSGISGARILVLDAQAPGNGEVE